MAPRKRNAAANTAVDNHIRADEKIARLLGMLLVKDIKKKTDQVPLLRRAGFSVAEVADMLSMEQNHVRVADHQGRKRRQTA